ncbi:MAG: hypothetical protein KIH10_16345 [Candidatus Freyarchaeota archaeon]|nr:hypothetical protein [Candidatus Jordarchaeia archaeon]MBS7281144.1 hypothetical protein [Candidatus Jordarchaeia archaeon]
MQVAKNSQVEKALERLRAMGLNVNVVGEGDDLAFIFITLDSVLRLISRQMKYPNKSVYFEAPFIVIKVWRG